MSSYMSTPQLGAWHIMALSKMLLFTFGGCKEWEDKIVQQGPN
jgi:hypothetical protein